MRAFHEQMPEGTDLLPGEGDKKVLVIGGGPAGMEAANIAAQRGYQVTLCEKNGYLGGLLPFASTIKGPHENLDRYNSYLIRQLEINGVEVVTGQEADADYIQAQGADVVILAVGGKRDTLGLTETDGTKIVAIQDIMQAEVGDHVVIVGGNAQAVDLCLYLQAQGKQVDIVMPDTLDKLDKEQTSWVRTFVLPMVYARGTRVFASASVKEVGDGSVTIATNKGVDMTITCDTLIEAMDMLPNTELIDGMENASAVGDCAKPWNIAEAVATANVAARHI
jgi:pyruvate/2-oxoglutarate dehydrogenase complex dihydrolipoamide dehydrogenase (E3) component